MSKRVDIVSDHLISALGSGSEENFNKLLNNRTGITMHNNGKYSDNMLPLGSINDEWLSQWAYNNELPEGFTRFEKLSILSISEALKDTSIDISSEDTLLVLSTTKGNVDLIEYPEMHNKLDLWYSAHQIAGYFKAKNRPRLISNACISGVVALMYAQWQLKEGRYKHAVVVGADTLSKFVVSGFESFMSLSSEICKPFDKNRDGLTIGEAAATMVLSTQEKGKVSIVKGATANDANHISGPSRTGEGLFQAIKHTLDNEDIQIDFISAHGTATPYNDDMESIAITRSGLNNVPVNGFKGYVGHTLGAAGIVEVIYSLWSMYHNKIIKTFGYNEFGVVEKVNIIDRNITKELNNVLKTASGFGGCNSALLLKKNG